MGASKLLHGILKFINYANLCKFIQKKKNATSLFLGRFLFCLFYLIGLGGGFKTSTQNFENHSVAFTLPPSIKRRKEIREGCREDTLI